MAVVMLIVATAALEHFIPGIVESYKWGFGWLLFWAVICDIGNWS